LRTSQLTKEFEALSSSLDEKEATVALLEGKLQSYQKTASTPEQLSDVITLTAEIAELKQKLKEAEFQKQQNTREAAVQDMEAKKKVEMQLHRITLTDHDETEVWYSSLIYDMHMTLIHMKVTFISLATTDHNQRRVGTQVTTNQSSQ